MINVKITGIPETISFLTAINKKIISLAEKGIKKAGFFYEGEVKQSIAGRRSETKSVDTGRFLNSINTKKTGNLEVTISSNVDYSKYLEYGTSRIQERRHFRNSLSRNKVKLNNIVEIEIKKA